MYYTHIHMTHVHSSSFSVLRSSESATLLKSAFHTVEETNCVYVCMCVW